MGSVCGDVRLGGVELCPSCEFLCRFSYFIYYTFWGRVPLSSNWIFGRRVRGGILDQVAVRFGSPCVGEWLVSFCFIRDCYTKCLTFVVETVTVGSVTCFASTYGFCFCLRHFLYQGFCFFVRTSRHVFFSVMDRFFFNCFLRFIIWEKGVSCDFTRQRCSAYYVVRYARSSFASDNFLGICCGDGFIVVI